MSRVYPDRNTKEVMGSVLTKIVKQVCVRVCMRASTIVPQCICGYLKCKNVY